MRDRSLPAGPRLPAEFFARDPCTVARELIGCELRHEGIGGIIVETEAYHESEPACHAHAGPTPRARVLFGPPGRAYVYLSYGIHQLFNVVTGREGEGAAVLVRALRPLRGIEVMRERRPGRSDEQLCSGPGKLTLALAIGPADNERDLGHGSLELRGRPSGESAPELVAGPRIGIRRAADLPWRWCASAERRFLSAPPGTLAAGEPGVS